MTNHPLPQYFKIVIEPNFVENIYSESKGKRQTIFQKENGGNDNKRSHSSQVIGNLTFSVLYV